MLDTSLPRFSPLHPQLAWPDDVEYFAANPERTFRFREALPCEKDRQTRLVEWKTDEVHRRWVGTYIPSRLGGDLSALYRLSDDGLAALAGIKKRPAKRPGA